MNFWQLLLNYLNANGYVFDTPEGDSRPAAAQPPARNDNADREVSPFEAALPQTQTVYVRMPDGTEPEPEKVDPSPEVEVPVAGVEDDEPQNTGSEMGEDTLPGMPVHDHDMPATPVVSEPVVTPPPVIDPVSVDEPAPADEPMHDHGGMTPPADEPAPVVDEAPADEPAEAEDPAPVDEPMHDHGAMTPPEEDPAPAEEPVHDHGAMTPPADEPAPADEPMHDHGAMTPPAEEPAEASEETTDEMGGVHSGHEEMPEMDPVSEENSGDHSGHDTSGSGDGMVHDHTDGHSHSHSDPSTAAITPPAADATSAEIDAFVDAVKAQGEDHAHMHDHDAGMMAEHMAAMDLTPRDEATHVAVSSGNWFDASTWHNGDIPTAGAKVLIPEGIEVDYAGVSDESIFTVRVDGALDFATDVDSRLVFDTMVVSPTGKLVAGTIDNPVAPDASVELIVAGNGPIDTTWDPMLLSRGIISHGETQIHGANKDSHEKVVEDPMAGDTSVTFAELPDGWEVGDTIVIAGTEYKGYSWDNDVRSTRHYESEDEERVITGIEGNTVYFDDPLVHDHDTPRDDLKTSVANYTRNVSIESQNGADSEIYERGHVMFMHSDKVDVRYAEFFQLGRTDKSIESDATDNFPEIDFDTNVQGRYSLHLHRTGVDDINNPVQIVGNAVYGSPGWGFVHHDSNADLTGNATFDTYGAGYVAETGNETGSWTDNIAIFAQGTGWEESKNSVRLGDDVFDTARGGDGFWFQGRLVESENNVAASVNHGFAYFHRDGDQTMQPVDGNNFIYSDALYGNPSVHADNPPILGFNGNEVFAARTGLEVVKSGKSQDHDVWTHINDLTAWSVQQGIFLEYTTHYLLSDIDVVGREELQFAPNKEGITLGKGTGDVVIADSKIDGFTTGIQLHNIQNTGDRVPLELTNYAVVDTQITNVDAEFTDYNPTYNFVGTRAELDSRAPDLELDPLVMQSGQGVSITGTKSDSLGVTDFPSGIITIEPDKYDVSRMLENDGYWETSEGDSYFLMDVYFSDRLTGDIYYETHAVDVNSIANGFGQWWSGDFKNAKYNGVQDIVTDASGVSRAGDTVLDQAIAAQPAVPMTQEMALMDDMHGAHHEVVHAAPGTLWESLTDGQGVWDETAQVIEEELETLDPQEEWMTA